MKIKIYLTNRKVPVSPFLLNLTEEARRWKELERILSPKINANTM
jgi:hypothetical protein